MAAAPQAVLEAPEPGGSLGCALVVHEEAGHEVAGREVDGHDGFPADAPDDRVKLYMPLQAVLFAESQEVVMGAPGLDAGGDVVLPPAPAGFELDCAGQVHAGGRVIALAEMAVDGALGAGDLRGVGHDMADMLALFKGVRDDAVCLVELLLVKGRALP